jgi:hypothetical protein
MSSTTTVIGDDATVIAPDTSNEPCDIKDWSDRWANRRRMSWAAFVAMCAVTAYIMVWVPIEKIDKLSDFLIWFNGTMASIILGYMGTTVSAHIFDRRR